MVPLPGEVIASRDVFPPGGGEATEEGKGCGSASVTLVLGVDRGFLGCKVAGLVRSVLAVMRRKRLWRGATWLVPRMISFL